MYGAAARRELDAFWQHVLAMAFSGMKNSFEQTTTTSAASGRSSSSAAAAAVTGGGAGGKRRPQSAPPNMAAVFTGCSNLIANSCRKQIELFLGVEISISDDGDEADAFSVVAARGAGGEEDALEI